MGVGAGGTRRRHLIGAVPKTAQNRPRTAQNLHFEFDQKIMNGNSIGLRIGSVVDEPVADHIFAIRWWPRRSGGACRRSRRVDVRRESHRCELPCRRPTGRRSAPSIRAALGAHGPARGPAIRPRREVHIDDRHAGLECFAEAFARQMAVDIDIAVRQLDLVARQSDHPLDVGLGQIGWAAKNGRPQRRGLRSA